jgi:hypothetical protein
LFGEVLVSYVFTTEERGVKEKEISVSDFAFFKAEKNTLISL